MSLYREPYLAQLARWPQSGRHILAHFDDDSIIVYQAYRPSIGLFAVKNGYFGGEFSLSRMSWIKPGFLWMAHRSTWASQTGQEVVLAVRLKRSAFETILAQAVHSTYKAELYANKEEWKQAIEHSSVRLQWDPDHDPAGAKVERRAIQLGLRGETLASYAREWIIDIEDVSELMHQQYQHVQTHHYEQLLTPRELVYTIADPLVATHLGIDVS